MNIRGSGILLHITSLDSDYGIGDLGPGAYHFVDVLSAAKQRYWQILPLNPTDPVNGNSPYDSVSAFAGNIFLISPEFMLRDGWLEVGDLKTKPAFSREKVDYKAVMEYKNGLFEKARGLFQTAPERRKKDYTEFCRNNALWLDDFARFAVIKRSRGGEGWSRWPAQLRDREEKALAEIEKEFADQIEKIKFLQYLFYRQWLELKSYANKKNVELIGDIPIYVSFDSADVWQYPRCFKLDDNKQPRFVAGVPPDYFSKTGQRWGNPVYDWDQLKKEGYGWWLKRLRVNLKLFNRVRIDHFRGLVAYWEIPAGDKTAQNGYWAGIPSYDFFETLRKEFPELPIIAEDLGTITPDVVEVMEHFDFPGMKVLLFAFGAETRTHPYIPENYVANCVAYTGTHDNNTARGWLQNEASPEEKKNLFEYFGREIPVDDIHWEMIRLLMGSVANTVIVPAQDVLGLGQETRMNTPATMQDNWRWRMLPGAFNDKVIETMAQLTETTQRGLRALSGEIA
jgi:4-alpha-glucanotransferase